MATALRFKVIDLNGDMIASCKCARQALMLSSLSGAGSKIRHMEWGIVWREGQESPSTMNAHERIARITQRITEKRDIARAKYEAMGRKAKP